MVRKASAVQENPTRDIRSPARDSHQHCRAGVVKNPLKFGWLIHANLITCALVPALWATPLLGLLRFVSSRKESGSSTRRVLLIRKRIQVLDLAEALYRDAAATVWTLGLTKEQRGRLVAQERE